MIVFLDGDLMGDRVLLDASAQFERSFFYCSWDLKGAGSKISTFDFSHQCHLLGYIVGEISTYVGFLTDTYLVFLVVNAHFDCRHRAS